MARLTASKNKLTRRAGQDLGLKTNPVKVGRRLNIPPGQHGRKGSKKMSVYGTQLREKQKLKWVYGLLEKQFRRYIVQATKNPQATGDELLRLLERRLDNVVYRLHFAPTRASARQMVVHGHVKVSGQTVDRPSFQVKIGDTITISSVGQKIPSTAALLAEKNVFIPKWLKRQAVVGQVNTLPEREDIDAQVNEKMIVEFYSR